MPVEKCWPGETVVCMATGPSLCQADVDACRRRARVIAINDAHRLAPWADVLYSSDRAWWPFYKGVPGFQGLRFSVGSFEGKANTFQAHPEIRVLTHTGTQGLETDPSGLRTHHNSGGAAINLAVHFGATRIILLGYDMQGSHFFGQHPARLRHAPQFTLFLRSMQTLVQPLKALGVTVINATRQTALTCFERQPLQSALDRDEELTLEQFQARATMPERAFA